MSPVEYLAWIASRPSTIVAVWSLSLTRITLNSTAVPSSDGNGPSAATCGLDLSACESGNCEGTCRTTLGSSARISFNAAFTFAVNAGSVVAPCDPVITNVSGVTSCSSCFCWSSVCARIASGLFVKSKSVVSALLNRTPDAPKPRIRITAQIPTVRQAWWLLARASVSGFSFTGSPPNVERIFDLLPSAS